MNTEVTDLIAALRTGAMSLEEVAERFRKRRWLRRPERPAPESYVEMAARSQEDPDAYLPGSFDDVLAAFDRGHLTNEQFQVLSEAAAESVNAEKQIQ